MRKKYTVDAIVDKKDASHLDREEESIKLDILLSDIPVKVVEGDIIEVEFEDNKIVFAKVDSEGTKKEREKARKLIEEMKARSSNNLKF